MPAPIPVAESLPVAPCPMPQPVLFAPPMMPMRYREPMKSSSSKWCVQTAKDDGHTCLQVCQGEDCKLTCEKFVLTVAEQSFKIAVHDNQVHIDSACLKATADKISHHKHKDQVVLEGHVKMRYSKEGQTAEMSGDMVVVDLGDGSVHLKPAPTEEQQIFSFFLGLFN
jgi:hypothetical protein